MQYDLLGRRRRRLGQLARGLVGRHHLAEEVDVAGTREGEGRGGGRMK